MSLEVIGRSLIILGLVIALVGGLLILAPRVPFLGRLPGDISLQRDGFSLYIPIATSLLLSLALTVLINVVLRILNR